MANVLRSGTAAGAVSLHGSVRRRLPFIRARIAKLAVYSWVLGIPPAHGAVLDTPYGTLPEQVMEICQPRTNLGPRPAVLLIHGGGWTGGDKSALSPRCRKIALYGYTVVNINYRLADAAAAGHSWPAALDDARQALVWLRTNAGSLGVDRTRIGIIGDSAGAQLAVFLGIAGLRDGVVCVVEESGPIDLLSAPSFTSVVNPAVFTMRPIEAAYRSASPVFEVVQTSAPTMIVHGRADPLVPFGQAEELLGTLRRNAVPAVMVAYDGGHVMQDTTASERQRVDAEEMIYLNSHLKPSEGIGNPR